MRPEDLLQFWFGVPGSPEHGKPRACWFSGGPSFDDEVRARFGDAQAAAMRGELEGWLETPRGALAYVVLLDQMSRNMYRGSARAFTADARARAATAAALARRDDDGLQPVERMFLYMPLMHSERLADQELSVRLFGGLAVEAPDLDELRYAIEHREVIARFGRFPSRNAVLGRPSTAAELEFLRNAPSWA